jgi:hypothetical protein
VLPKKKQQAEAVWAHTVTPLKTTVKELSLKYTGANVQMSEEDSKVGEDVDERVREVTRKRLE